MKVHKLIPLLLMLVITMTLCSCPDDESHGKTCRIHLVNNSFIDVEVGARTIVSPYYSASESEDVRIGYLGSVEARDEYSNLWLWFMLPDEEPSWLLFFNEFHLGTLELFVFRNFKDFQLWYSQQNDSVALKRYQFTLSDLPKYQNTVTITYP